MTNLIPLPKDIEANKDLGQNFLINKKVVLDIVDALELDKEDILLEVGPGTGSLTFFMNQACKRVFAIEKDKKLVSCLEEKLEENKLDNIFIIEGDILKFKLKDFLKEEKINKVVSNLPYYITSPIIMRFIQLEEAPDLMVFMTQKEVADRLLRGKTDQAGGILTILARYKYDLSHVLDVSSHDFIPSPQVTSSVVKFVKRKDLLDAEVESLLFALVKTGFANKRKKLSNCLSASIYPHVKREDVEKLLEKLSIRPDARAQQLSVEDFKNLAKAFIQLNKK